MFFCKFEHRVCMCSTTTQRVLLLQRPVDVAVHWAERFLELSVIQAAAAANAAYAAPALFSLSICRRRAPRSSGQSYRRRYRRAHRFKVAKTRRKQAQWFHKFFHAYSRNVQIASGLFTFNLSIRYRQIYDPTTESPPVAIVYSPVA